MVADFKKLAVDIKTKHANTKMVAINMSKVSKPKEAFGIKTYPHVKFFGKGDA